MSTENTSDNKTNKIELKQEVVINGDTFLVTVKGEMDFDITKIIANPDIDPDPEPEPEEPKPDKPDVDPHTGTIKKGSKWSPNPGKAETWKIVPMQDKDKKAQGLFKIIAEDKLNVIADLESKEIAEALIKYFTVNPFPPKETNDTNPVPNPIPVDAKVDAQGVVMIYSALQGGQVITEDNTYTKQSKHNTGPRTSVYAKKEYTANSGEITQGFTMSLSKNDEQNAPKVLSGKHGSDPQEQGCCYAVGINQDGTLHFAKEYPKHPTTKKYYDAIQYVKKGWDTLGNIKGKKVFMKVIYYPIEKDGKEIMHFEWWFDVRALDTNQLENDWQQMAWAEDTGNLNGPPLLENQGVEHGGQPLGFYVRIDEVEKPVDFTHLGQHELLVPVKRLV